MGLFSKRNIRREQDLDNETTHESITPALSN